MKNMRESEEQITVVKKRKSIERERKKRKNSNYDGLG